MAAKKCVWSLPDTSWMDKWAVMEEKRKSSQYFPIRTKLLLLPAIRTHCRFNVLCEHTCSWLYYKHYVCLTRCVQTSVSRVCVFGLAPGLDPVVQPQARIALDPTWFNKIFQEPHPGLAWQNTPPARPSLWSNPRVWVIGLIIEARVLV